MYSTCSVYTIENENVVKNILRKNSQVKLVEIFPEHSLRGFEGNNNDVFDMEMKKTIREST